MSPKINTNYYDIVILPSKEVRDVAIVASRTIHKQFGSKLVLGERLFKPHISLYHVAVVNKDVPEMIRRLRMIASKQKFGPLTVHRSTNQPHFAIKKIAWLQNLHQSVVAAINPLRDKHFPNTWKNWGEYGNIVKSVHRKNIQK